MIIKLLSSLLMVLNIICVVFPKKTTLSLSSNSAESYKNSPFFQNLPDCDKTKNGISNK